MNIHAFGGIDGDPVLEIRIASGSDTAPDGKPTGRILPALAMSYFADFSSLRWMRVMRRDGYIEIL